ncbi:MAG: hypothetical protein U0271_16275 [Polyangiaceae bacterium]
MTSAPKTEEALSACATFVAAKPPKLEDAIDRALEAWGRTRHPRIADLVDRLSSAYEPEARALASAARKEAVAARKARAKNATEWSRKARHLEELLLYLKTRTAVDACWKLSTLHDEYLDEDPKSRGFTAADAKRMAASRRPDPRVARALFRVLCEPKFHRERRSVDSVIPRLIELGDARYVGALRDWLESANLPQPVAKNGSSRAEVERLLTELSKIAATPPPLSSAAAALLEEIETRVPALEASAERPRTARTLTKTAAEVLEAVFADPDNVELRRVAGDRLQELGDLRGELIALQFALLDNSVKRDREATAKRIKSLLHKNAGHWSGPVGPIGRHETIEFELGFITSTMLDKSSIGMTAEMWTEAVDTPYWATVKRLILTERVPDWWIRAFLPSPRAARIRTLELRARGGKQPEMVLARDQPGAPLRLVAVKKFHAKFPKLLGTFTPEHLAMLADDAQRLTDLPKSAHKQLMDALVKAMTPPSPKRNKKAAH